MRQPRSLDVIRNNEALTEPKGSETLGLLNYDDMGELRGISAPTMPNWGDDDRLVGRDRQDQLAELITGGELLVCSGIGHTPRWEEPSRFAGDVAGLVERVGRG